MHNPHRGDSRPPFNSPPMKYLIQFFTAIGMVVTLLSILAITCYIHDAL